MSQANADAVQTEVDDQDDAAALVAEASVEGDGAGEGAANEPTDGEIEVTIEGAAPAQDAEPDDSRAPKWVTELRRERREVIRERDQLKEQIRQLQGTTQLAPVVIGAEPTLEGCGYDGQKFATEYKAWMQRSQEAERQRTEAEAKQRSASEEWNKKITAYQTGKTTLRVSDFDAAEDVVKDTLSQLQQSILISGADKPELVIYALGKNPGKARELAAIKDPVKFAFALSKLEDKLKVQPRKPATPPEQRLPTGGRVAGEAAVESSPDKTLAKLREEAMKTGDLSKVIAYKSQQKARAA